MRALIYYDELKARSKPYHREDSELVFARHWNDGSEILVEISRRDDGYGETWTMTAAFMVWEPGVDERPKALCSCDVQDGYATECFDKLAMRMIGA